MEINGVYDFVVGLSILKFNLRKVGFCGIIIPMKGALKCGKSLK